MSALLDDIIMSHGILTTAMLCSAERAS